MSMREITAGQAVREAMAEEMRRDPAVFCMGEDVAFYGGSFKITKGLLDEFGPERVTRYADLRGWFRRRRRRRRPYRHAPRGRGHVL